MIKATLRQQYPLYERLRIPTCTLLHQNVLNRRTSFLRFMPLEKEVCIPALDQGESGHVYPECSNDMWTTTDTSSSIPSRGLTTSKNLVP